MTPLPYSRQSITDEDIAAVVEVLRGDYLTTGPKVPEFEAALAEFVGAKYAVAVSSGTAALHLLARAHDPATNVWGSTVIASALSFVATANAWRAERFGVRFADVDPESGAMFWPDPAKLAPDFIVPVHLFGRAMPIPPAGATWNGTIPTVIEDACHALGAMDFDGCSRVGSCAHSKATVFSFHPVKPITTGEGGAITTNDEGLAELLRSLASHGRNADGEMVRLGLNYRMSDIAAALGLSQLRRCLAMLEDRLALEGLYRDRFSTRYGAAWKTRPNAPGNAWHLYPLRISARRDEVKAALRARGIGAQVHYSPIIPLQPYWRNLTGAREGDFPNAEAWAAEELSLPLFSGMTEADVDRVVDALAEAVGA